MLAQIKCIIGGIMSNLMLAFWGRVKYKPFGKNVYEFHMFVHMLVWLCCEHVVDIFILICEHLGRDM